MDKAKDAKTRQEAAIGTEQLQELVLSKMDTKLQIPRDFETTIKIGEKTYSVTAREGTGQNADDIEIVLTSGEDPEICYALSGQLKIKGARLEQAVPPVPPESDGTITTATELRAALEANEDIVLGENIHLDETYPTWNPISSYSGHFDGGGYTLTVGSYGKGTITNPYSADTYAFISNLATGGVIEDLVIVKDEAFEVFNGNPISEITFISGFVAFNQGTIRNCRSEVSMSAQPASNNENVFMAGIATINSGGTVSSCMNLGTLTELVTNNRMTKGDIIAVNI